jgi:hypothetical protein
MSNKTSIKFSEAIGFVAYLFCLISSVDCMGSKDFDLIEKNAAYDLNTYRATTPNLREIFFGRCFYYINILQKANGDFNGSQYDCRTIWQAFYTAATSQPCTIDDYNEFLNLTDQIIPSNGSLFWSGTSEVSHSMHLPSSIFLFLNNML